MTDRPSTPGVLSDWARAPIPIEPGSGAEERRARIVSQMARTIRETQTERRRSERRWRALLLAGAAAALVLLVGGLWRGLGNRSATVGARVHTDSAGVLISHGAESRTPAATGDEPLMAGDVLSTVADGRATLRLASGAEVRVEPSSRVTLTALSVGGEQLDLGLGEVAVRVPPLRDRGSFRVRTPDTSVVVHGTAFVVRVTAREGGTETSVTVSEGKVSVEHAGETTFVTAGQSWTSKPPREAAQAAPAAPPAPVSSSPEPLPPPALGASPRKLPGAAPAPSAPVATAATDPSVLAEQNRLFSAAAAARKAGDDRAALGHLNQLLARYPQSPLAPEARVERFRTLKRLGQHAEAAREARRYLLDHQTGAARDEARGVALEPSGK